jgi:hypothetical protein
VIGKAQRQRDDGQRGRRCPSGWKSRTAGDEEVRDTVHLTVPVDHTLRRIVGHTGRAHVMPEEPVLPGAEHQLHLTSQLPFSEPEHELRMRLTEPISRRRQLNPILRIGRLFDLHPQRIESMRVAICGALTAGA